MSDESDDLDDVAPTEGDDELSEEGKRTKRKVFGQLTFLLNDYMREKKRTDSLILFSDRSEGSHRRRPKSTVKYMDNPETELAIYHIGRIDKLDKQIGYFEALLEKPEQSPVVMVEGGQVITKMNAQRQFHLTQLHTILTEKRRRLAKQEELITAVVNNRLKLAQDEAHHREKLHREDTRAKENDLVDSLCKKYNIDRAAVYQRILRRPDPEATAEVVVEKLEHQP